MKKLVLALFLLLATRGAARAQTKAFINKETKSFMLVANMREDHQIYGYSSASLRSKKLLLFSIFTSDVKGNPHRLPLGAYYETSGLKEGDQINFVSDGPAGFVKLSFVSAGHGATPFYVQRKFVVFD